MRLTTLVIAPIAARYGTRVLHEFRPLVPVDDDQYNRLVKEAARTRPASEVIAFGIGVILGLWLNQSWLSEVRAFWLGRYWLASLSLMYGLLGWLIYGLITDARLMARLHRQPLQIDILDGVDGLCAKINPIEFPVYAGDRILLRP